MPGTKEIRTKIASVKSTQKITKAMQMVATSKMRRAQDRMKLARPYADKTGNPNGSGLAAWRPFNPAANDVMGLSRTPGMRPIASPERLGAWRGVYN